MALSDTCSEVSIELAKAVIGYGSRGYSVEHWDKIIAAMFNIADVSVPLDMSPSVRRSDYHSIAHRRVLHELLMGEHEAEEVAEALPMLAEVARRNARFAEAIDDVFAWMKSEEGIAVCLANDWQSINIGPLYRLLHEE